MLVIRLTRVGKKKQPTFRLIVQEKNQDPWGRSKAILGSYNPRVPGKMPVIDVEATKAWLAKGAQPSPSAHNLLVAAKVLESKKVKAHSGNRADGTKDAKPSEEKK